MLSFNAKAKSRPNFGLQGVGYWTSDTYSRPNQNYWMVIVFGVPAMILIMIMNDGFFSKVDAMAGGGPSELDYGWRKEDKKPWDFSFDVGEGYAAGPARHRPAPGAYVLPDHDHSKGHH